ncbi:MAG: thioredoxin family protein [Desulfobacterales bacterium]|nr:thioredoxin family protein [Desulfobacterales bacterium]
MDLAKNQNKHIFLYFHADWCTYCKDLKKTTFKNKAVLDYLKDNFISVKVDTDKNNKLATQWNVKGLPTLWFLKPDNSKINSVPGYVNPEQFLHILKYIHTASYDKMSFQEFIKTI